MDNEKLKEALQEIDRNKQVIDYRDKKYDPEKLYAEISKGTRIHLDSKIAFHEEHFDPEQVPAEWYTKMKMAAVTLYEGKYVVIFAPRNMPVSCLTEVIFVSTFNLKKAKHISLEERNAIAEANMNTSEPQPTAYRSTGSTHWGAKKTYSGSNRLSSTSGAPQRFGAPRTPFNGRGK